ncbi:LamB/YcsF family protein [Plantactinospora sp. BC1]|uniref:LamB/YcsF family protein n=1 Tax=Plantactinospora sp. BC1 TaxID=2108470 RepID=UPI000D15D57B|nr:5-oxoprolinase subunit PxpA [Plantactinospora sp. BC1]AVT29261.1 LamB/YcsF family protein [Plantactinospora sp. BC1]
MSVILDLNSDLGEGFGVWELGDDMALLSVVTSANVACGFHGGDPTIMRRVCAEAISRDVSIGAHVGYRDLAGFGRRAIDMEPDRLSDDVLYQLAALDGIARSEGGRVRYVKPHGALYNRTVTDQAQAAAVVTAVSAYDPSLPILGLPGSQLLRQAAEVGLKAVREAFADRGYRSDGSLAKRGSPGALVTDPDAVARRCVKMATTGQVAAVDGAPVSVRARSICVHGDTPGAVQLARQVHTALQEAGVSLASFV